MSCHFLSLTEYLILICFVFLLFLQNELLCCNNSMLSIHTHTCRSYDWFFINQAKLWHFISDLYCEMERRVFVRWHCTRFVHGTWNDFTWLGSRQILWQNCRLPTVVRPYFDLNFSLCMCFPWKGILSLDIIVSPSLMSEYIRMFEDFLPMRWGVYLDRS